MPEKILFVRPTMGQGGADRVTATLLGSLDRAHFAPSLALMRPEGALLEQVPGDVPVHDLGGGRLWSAWWPLARLLRRERPEVLFSTSSGANLIAAVAHLLARRPCRLVLSERNVLLHGLGLKPYALLAAKRLLYRRADRITAVAEGVKADLVARLRLPPDRITVTYNPVVDSELRRQAEEPLEHPWFAPGSPPVLLGVGRLVAEKNFPLLIRAFARLRAGRPLRLVILGEGPLRAELLELAAELGVAAAVDLPGFDPNPFRYMARAAVFALTSRHEGLPGVLIQAVAVGAPSVATDCASGPSEIITHGEDGFLVPVDSVEELVARLEQLLDDPELRAQLSAKSRKSAERFEVHRVVERYARALLSA